MITVRLELILLLVTIIGAQEDPIAMPSCTLRPDLSEANRDHMGCELMAVGPCRVVPAGPCGWGMRGETYICRDRHSHQEFYYTCANDCYIFCQGDLERDCPDPIPEGCLQARREGTCSKPKGTGYYVIEYDCPPSQPDFKCKQHCCCGRKQGIWLGNGHNPCPCTDKLVAQTKANNLC